MGTLAAINFLLMLVNIVLSIINGNRGNFRLAWACLGVAAVACVLFVYCLAHTPRPW